MLEFRTNTLKTRKKALIDGVEYTVRHFGNIEAAEQRRFLRRLADLAEKEKTEKLTEEESREVSDISDKLSLMYVDLFDDGGDGSKSKALVSSLSDVELGLLLGQILSDKKEDETS